jgi:thiol-disulfide isomerase/thioredoxin
VNAASAHAAPAAGSIDGRWAAVLSVEEAGRPAVLVPFRLDISTNSAHATGYLFDGDLRIASTTGSFRHGKLHLRFDAFSADFKATLRDGTITGTYKRRSAKTIRERAVTAHRFVPEPEPVASAPSIAGDWALRGLEDGKEVIWKFVVQQSGPDVKAAILRLDGDTGSLTGTFRDGKLSVSHFSGARPSLLEGKLLPDGSLDLSLDRHVKLVGVPMAEARAKGFPEPADPMLATTVKDPGEPFQFRFPDLKGRLVSADSSRFRGKVLIASIGGSWCPNCMDEAPFLVDLYQRYHARGLEIVGLEFESGELEYDRKRVASFVQRFSIPYPVLLAGSTDEVKEKLPQLVNFSAFPTTIFMGRDGRVIAIHDGFASVATGQEHAKLKRETDEMVERLLAGGDSTGVSSR